MRSLATDPHGHFQSSDEIKERGIFRGVKWKSPRRVRSLADERGSLSDAFKEHQALKEKRDALKKEIREKEERQDLARFQKEEIEKAALQTGEDTTCFNTIT